MHNHVYLSYVPFLIQETPLTDKIPLDVIIHQPKSRNCAIVLGKVPLPTTIPGRYREGVIIYPDDMSMIVEYFDGCSEFLVLYPYSILMIVPGIPLCISPWYFSSHSGQPAARATRMDLFQIPMVMTHDPGHSRTSLEELPRAPGALEKGPTK